MPRRSRPDPLAVVNATRWVTVSTMWGKVLDWQVLPPRTDLRRALCKMVDRMQVEGWWAESSFKWGCFLMRNGEKRLEVRISAIAPDAPPVGHQLPAWPRD